MTMCPQTKNNIISETTSLLYYSLLKMIALQTHDCH